jgi:hypothetical protein
VTSSFISHVTVDCADAYTLAEWWKPVVGYQDVPDDPNLPGHDECMIVDPDGKGVPVLFVEVPEGKSVKNRLHLDLRPREDLRDTEIERVIRHGATIVGDHRGQYGPGTGWVTLADPEGNEFCILRSLAEVEEQAAQPGPAEGTPA